MLQFFVVVALSPLYVQRMQMNYPLESLCGRRRRQICISYFSSELQDQDYLLIPISHIHLAGCKYVYFIYLKCLHRKSLDSKLCEISLSVCLSLSFLLFLEINYIVNVSAFFFYILAQMLYARITSSDYSVGISMNSHAHRYGKVAVNKCEIGGLNLVALSFVCLI